MGTFLFTLQTYEHCQTSTMEFFLRKIVAVHMLHESKFWEKLYSRGKNWYIFDTVLIYYDKDTYLKSQIHIWNCRYIFDNCRYIFDNCR